MKDYEWKSPLASCFQEYIAIKKTSGLKFCSQERVLQHFDSFIFFSGHDSMAITKEMTETFIYNSAERKSTWNLKERVLIGFSTYLRQLGHTAHIPQNRTALPRPNHIPHIYTADELARFFAAMDSYPDTLNTVRKTVDPVLFRFLYSTGARLSEALNLSLSDVDPDRKCVTVRQGKNNKDRLLPLHPAMAAMLDDYISAFHRGHGADTKLFPSAKLTRMDLSTAYRHFRDYLLMAGISHTAEGPRIHDLRHTMAVENLRRWSAAGNDLLNMVPYLSAYLGHADFRETQYYLRLTADIYPEMVRQMEAACLEIIPEGGVLADEA